MTEIKILSPPLPYTTFREMPERFENIHEWFSIYFNLRKMDVNGYLEEFRSGRYLKNGLKDAKILNDFFGKLEKVKTKTLSDFIVWTHLAMSAWAMWGIRESLIDLTPVNLENLVKKEELGELEVIKNELSRTTEFANSLFMKKMEEFANFLKEKNFREVKEEYVAYFTEKAEFKDFVEFMNSCLLQIVYKHPGALRLKNPPLYPAEVKEFILIEHIFVATGASPGKIRGTAVKATTPKEAEEKIRKVSDPILFAPKTDPSWLPVLAKVKGIVTAVGGILSHAAIVAREFGIPCIVGAEKVFEKVEDGTEVEIDGSKGEIKLIR